MNQATYFETRRFSPTSMTVIIALHAVALTTALTWRTVFILPDRTPTVVTMIPVKDNPPEATKDTPPRPRQVDVYIPPSPLNSPRPDEVVFSKVTDIVLPGPLTIDEGPPTPPAPSPQPLVQSARARGDVRTLITSDDYPESARRSEQAGTVQARLEIGTDGKVTGCTILNSSGSAALDSTTCKVLQRRARFTPARNGDGQAVSDSYVTPRIVWKIEGRG